MTRPVVVLANPTANRGRGAAVLSAVVDHLAVGGPVEVLMPPTRAAALDAARAAVATGPRALVTVGGDGTVHLGVQAVAGTDVAFGVIPAGTGNDFAAAVGMPPSPREAADAICAALAADRTTPVDAARVTAADGSTAWYAGVLGAGFDSLVNERANRMRFPRGPRRYDLAIFVELMRLRSLDVTVTVDGVAHRGPTAFVAVGNIPSYGGGMRITPHADPADGLLDVVVVGALSRATLVRVKPRVYAGTHVTHPLVTEHRGREVTLDAAGIVAYADGERLFPLPITITCVPGALRVLC